jgi:hypothetical protein
LSGAASRQIRTASDAVPDPLEAVKDHVKAVFELVGEIVAGLHRVLGDEGGEVRVLARRERLEHAFGHRRNVGRRIEREIHLGQGEAVDVGVQEGVGMGIAWSVWLIALGILLLV